MRIAQLATRERPRERLVQHGIDVLSDTELLALLLGTGTAQEDALTLAARMLEKGLLHLSSASHAELCSIRGIGSAKAAQLLAAFELHRRLAVEQAPTIISNAQDAYKYCAPLLGHLEQEHVLILCLNARNSIIGHSIITKGLADTALIHPREVFREAIRCNAAAIIIAHNHPSGDLSPSPEDIEATNAMKIIGSILGIPLLDHLIITRGAWQAIASSGS